MWSYGIGLPSMHDSIYQLPFQRPSCARGGCCMPLDPEKVAECRAWLGRAWADLDSAGILLGADRPRPDTALFHCQQAAEKAWKAFLFWGDMPFRKTHNLRELGEACARLDRSLASLAERAEDLTQ